MWGNQHAETNIKHVNYIIERTVTRSVSLWNYQIWPFNKTIKLVQMWCNSPKVKSWLFKKNLFLEIYIFFNNDYVYTHMDWRSKEHIFAFYLMDTPHHIFRIIKSSLFFLPQSFCFYMHNPKYMCKVYIKYL